MNIAAIQKVIPTSFLPAARWSYCQYQKYNTIFYSRKERISYNPIKKKKSILIYHPSLLSFGGTEKNLQIIAKYLDKETYDVYVMYGEVPRKLGNYNEQTITIRKQYVNEGGPIHWVPFIYSSFGSNHPYVLKNMTPRIEHIIQTYAIDCVITAGAGNAEFPLTDISCPIIYINIFGIPNVLHNIKKQICISHLVKDMINDIISTEKLDVLYIPSEGPLALSIQDGKHLRQKLGISEDDIIFGRIGRADDVIYDPIGITAFDKVVRNYPKIHYVIISPAPLLLEFIGQHKTPNIHLIDPISTEKEIWAFHNMIDVLAHFRADGETCGLNIAESMLCAKPIISHKSKGRNAHLEYLDENNSFVADVDNTEEYAYYIEIFARDFDKELIKKMGSNSQKIAFELFYIDSYMKHFNDILDEVLMMK